MQQALKLSIVAFAICMQQINRLRLTIHISHQRYIGVNRLIVGIKKNLTAR